MLDRLLAWNLAALSLLLVLAHMILLYAIIRRAGRGAGKQAAPAMIPMPNTVRRSTLLARLWTAWLWLSRLWAAETIPTLLSCLLFAAMAITSEQLWGSLRYQGSAPAAMQVEVVGQQFLPAGREVDIRLRALDVIHGFFIPGMRLKQNAVPGLELHVHFTPVTPGTYPILCTQVCGSGHARMQALLRVVPPAQFDEWIADRERKLASRLRSE
jgi:cytochrome c oxidase subunit 2